MDIKNTLVVADALHCKKKSAEKVVENGGDYLLVVKKNNPNLCKEVELYSYNQKDDEYTTEEKTGGRIEKRTAYVANNLESFHKNGWKKLACVGSIHREVEKNLLKQVNGHIIFIVGT